MSDAESSSPRKSLSGRRPSFSSIRSRIRKTSLKSPKRTSLVQDGDADSLNMTATVTKSVQSASHPHLFIRFLQFHLFLVALTASPRKAQISLTCNPVHLNRHRLPCQPIRQ